MANDLQAQFFELKIKALFQFFGQLTSYKRPWPWRKFPDTLLYIVAIWTTKGADGVFGAAAVKTSIGSKIELSIDTGPHAYILNVMKS